MIPLHDFLDIRKGRRSLARIQVSEDANHVAQFRHFAFYVLAMVAALGFVAAPGLAGTKFIRHWVRTSQPPPVLHKVLVTAIMENYLIRQEFEDEMERRLAKSGVVGVKSHMVLPPRNELKDEQELNDFIKKGGYDAVLVVQPKATRTETEEKVNRFVGPAYRPPPGYYQFWANWETSWAAAKSTKVFTTERTMVSAEINLYTVSNDELIWSGETDTVYTKDFQKLGRDYAKALVAQLIKDKIITKN